MVSLAIFKGEKSIDELAARLFPPTAGGTQAQATAALLKANPQLADLSRLPAGAIVVVPDLPAQAASSGETIRATTLAPSDPIRVLGDQATAFGTALATQAASAAAQADATLKLLQDSGLTAAAARDQTLAKRLTTLSDGTKAALKDMQTQQAAIQQALAQLQQDLAKFIAPTLPSTPPAPPTPPTPPTPPVTPPAPPAPPVVSNPPTPPTPRPPITPAPPVTPPVLRAPRAPRAPKKTKK